MATNPVKLPPGFQLDLPEGFVLDEAKVPETQPIGPRSLPWQAVGGVGKAIRRSVEGLYGTGKAFLAPPENEEESLYAQFPGGLALKRLGIEPARELQRKARTALSPIKSLAYSAASAIPLAGPMAAQFVEEAGESFGKGEYLAPVAEAATYFALPKLARGTRLAAAKTLEATTPVRTAMGGRVMNALIRTGGKEFEFNRNPGKTIAELAEPQVTFENQLKEIRRLKGEAGEQIGNALSQPGVETIESVPARDVVRRIVAEFKRAATEQSVRNRVQEVGDFWEREIVPEYVNEKGIATTSGTWKLKRRFDESGTKFKESTLDDPTVNSMKEALDMALRDEIVRRVPGLNSLNQDYGNLAAAETAAAREFNVRRGSPLGPSVSLQRGISLPMLKNTALLSRTARYLTPRRQLSVFPERIPAERLAPEGTMPEELQPFTGEGMARAAGFTPRPLLPTPTEPGRARMTVEAPPRVFQGPIPPGTQGPLRRYASEETPGTPNVRTLVNRGAFERSGEAPPMKAPTFGYPRAGRTVYSQPSEEAQALANRAFAKRLELLAEQSDDTIRDLYNMAGPDSIAKTELAQEIRRRGLRVP